MNYPIETQERPAAVQVPCPQAECRGIVAYDRKARRVTCPACGWGVILFPKEVWDFTMIRAGIEGNGAQFLQVIAARCCDVADKPAPLAYREDEGKWHLFPPKAETVLEELERRALQAEINGVILYPDQGGVWARSQQRNNPAAGPYEIWRHGPTMGRRCRCQERECRHKCPCRPGVAAIHCTCPRGITGRLCAHLALYYRHLSEDAAWQGARAALVAQFTPRDEATTRETDEAILARAEAARRDLFGND